jgi:hypothetical protein
MTVSNNHFASTELQLSEEQRNVLPRIQKLLSLAANNSSPEEAASAAARAQELLLAYNLSSDLLDQDLEGGTRGQEQLRGGSREYERDLWGWVAELNFCLHWVGQRRQKMPRRFKPGDYWYGREDVPDYAKFRTQHSWHHFLIGRKANVAATIAMAGYLQKRVDDLAMEFVYGDEKMRYSQRAMSFREGAVAVIVNKLIDRRRDQLLEERKAQADAQRRADEAAAKGISTATALTIAGVRQSEDDLNRDLMFGQEPGTTARQRAERAARQAAAEAEYTRWAAEHPEEAAAQERERLAQAEKDAARRARRGAPRGKDVDGQAWLAGRKAGDAIGLDPQAGQAKPKAYL